MFSLFNKILNFLYKTNTILYVKKLEVKYITYPNVI